MQQTEKTVIKRKVKSKPHLKQSWPWWWLHFHVNGLRHRAACVLSPCLSWPVLLLSSWSGLLVSLTPPSLCSTFEPHPSNYTIRVVDSTNMRVKTVETSERKQVSFIQPLYTATEKRFEQDEQHAKGMDVRWRQRGLTFPANSTSFSFFWISFTLFLCLQLWWPHPHIKSSVR